MNTTLLVILLVIAYALLAIVKLYVQSKYSKKNVHNFTDTVIFWAFIFLIIAICFIPVAIINHEINTSILIYAILAGIFTVFFQLFYTLALSCGPVGISSFLTSASSVVYIVYSIIVFNEKITPFKIAAFVLFVAALACNIKKDKSKNINAKWIILISLTCLFLIAGSIVSKYFARDFAGDYKTGFLAIEYIVSFVLTAIIAIPLVLNNKTKPSIKFDKWYFIFGISIGVILVACVFINQWTVSIADMSYFTPIRGSMIMILAILEGWIVFNEKPTLLQTIGIVCGIGASILINF